MTVATASTTVKFHEFPSGNVLHHYQPGTHIDGPIRSISWSKDGNWLALVPHSGLVEIVSVKDQLKLIHTIQVIKEPSCATFQNTTKKNIAIGTKNGQVLVYDIKSRSVKKRYHSREMSVVTRVEFTAKDNHVVAACENGEAYIFSSIQNNLSGTFKIPRSQTISALRTNPIKRNYIVAGSSEGVVAVWDIHGNKNKFFIGSHKAPVTDVAFSPINADLVVSAGLDRQFCFYDIGGNKCIGNIFVENSMTSVDFSPDGKFVVMASQTGKIYIYDSKNIQQPIHSFHGHNGAVQHVSFRKSEDYESSFNMSSGNLKESTSSHPTTSFDLDMLICGEPTKSAISLSSTDANDSFMAAMGIKQNNSAISSHSSAKVEDSFMVAMGLDQNNTAQSNKPDYSARTSDSSKKFFMHKFTPTNPSRLIQERINSEAKIPVTSTPDYISQDIYPIVSPIVDLDPRPCLENTESCLENIHECVKRSVKEELKIVAAELKTEMKYYSTHNLAQTRQMCLDLMMSMVKESIKMENSFNSLRADLINEAPENQSSSLIEENLMLKQRIALLEEEISALKKRFNLL